MGVYLRHQEKSVRWVFEVFAMTIGKAKPYPSSSRRSRNFSRAATPGIICSPFRIEGGAWAGVRTGNLHDLNRPGIAGGRLV
jgi:hypothetical protein